MTEAKSNSAKQEAHCSDCSLHCIEKWIKIVIYIQLISSTFAAMVCIPRFIEFVSEVRALNGSLTSFFFSRTDEPMNHELMRRIVNDTHFGVYSTVFATSSIGITNGFELLQTLKLKEISPKLLWIFIVGVNWMEHFREKLYEFLIPENLFLITLIPYCFGIYLLLILIVTRCKERPNLAELLFGSPGTKRHKGLVCTIPPKNIEKV